MKPDIILFDIMMEPMDGWETLEKIKENSATEKIPVLMFRAKIITPAEAKEHSINIDDFVSKPVSPSQLLDLIQWIFSRRNNIKGQLLVAQNKGLDPAVINEYSALRKRIEVDKNLLLVLRSSCGMNTPGRDVPVKMGMRSGILKTRFTWLNGSCGRSTICLQKLPDPTSYSRVVL